MGTYKRLWQVVQLPSVMKLIVVLMTCRVGLACAEAVTALKLQVRKPMADGPTREGGYHKCFRAPARLCLSLTLTPARGPLLPYQEYGIPKDDLAFLGPITFPVRPRCTSAPRSHDAERHSLTMHHCPILFDSCTSLCRRSLAT